MGTFFLGHSVNASEGRQICALPLIVALEVKDQGQIAPFLFELWNN